MGAYVAKALRTVVETLGRSVPSWENMSSWYVASDSNTYVFSYREHFATLWGLDGPGNSRRGLAGIAEEVAGRKLNLVVVWDGQPDDVATSQVNVLPYVTPYEWAVALSLVLYRRFYRGSDQGQRPTVRILILDVTKHRPDAGFIGRALYAFQNTFPWIQDYKVVATETEMLEEATEEDTEIFARLRQRIPVGRRDVRCLIKDLVEPKRVLSMLDDCERELPMEAFAESWRQQLLKAGSRHDVANLLGPIVLAQGLPDNLRKKAWDSILGRALPRAAMLDVVAVLELLDIQATAFVNRVGPKQIGLEEGGGIFGRRHRIKFLLVDDQYHLGYQHILGYTIFGSSYDPNLQVGGSELARLKCVDNWELLHDTIRACKEVKDWSLPRRLVVPNCDVLLLDLRLWMDRETGKRKDFMTDLTRACAQLNATKIKDPYFIRALAAAIRLAQGEEGVSELPALTLLPLLLSHYDPSLPIVLFSSTHQREVLECVSHRPNIITTFAKPLLTGYGAEKNPEEGIPRLSAALQRSIELHEARMLWERICDANWEWKPPFKVFIGMSQEITYNVVGGKDHIPSVSGEVLKRRLRFFYLNYLLRESYYDFSPMPFELIEGAITPENHKFDLITDNNVNGGAHNRLAIALRTIRHRKAHGFAKPSSNKKERREWCIASILAFLILLDYVQEKSTTTNNVSLAGTVTRFWKYLKKRHSERLGNMKDWRTPAYPEQLIRCQGLPWIDFSVYAVFNSIKDGMENNKVFVAPETWCAIRRLLKTLADIEI